ncbi:MAG: sugar dehydrogenase complex small subunit [Xanthobacteraceae bacterium]
MEFLLRSGISPETLGTLEPDSYAAGPIEKRLLDAWYTGVFKIDGLPDVRSYRTTLMWRAAGLSPPPGTCGGGPSGWASAPSNI